ncbi:MAG TPA: phosphatase PAP2 family protein [Roseiflexaceae bacterium]|nr:phosphatase PAP2 family protein [Roseiflexaceae bacterium]
MAHPPDLSHETLAPAEESRALQLARLLSIVFNPMFVGIAAYLVVGLYAPGSGLAWAGLTVLLQVLPPLMFYLVQLRRGVFSDVDVSVREERNQLYLFSSASVLVTIAVLAAAGVPRPLLALAVGTLALGVVCGITNLFWKISMHAAGMGSLATVALLYAGPLGLALWGTAAAVGWARVRTRNHTPLQVLAGFVASTVTLAATFAFLGQ